MLAYIVRRLIQALVVIFIVTLLVFFMVRLLPGDPILIYMSQQEVESFDEEQLAHLRHEFGLDKPVIMQYFSWIGNLLKWDLGKSLYYHEDVSKLLKHRLPVTLYLGILAFALSTIVGISAGTISAIRRGTITDTLVTMLANIGITIPVFWLGIILVYIFGLRLHFLPLYGFTSPFTDFGMNIKQSILPVFCLAVFSIASKARQTRSAMLEVIMQDYIRTAYSKGLKENVVVRKHILKNGLIPVVTLLGVSLSHIIGGSVLVESVFSIPGMGKLSVEALFSKDYAIIQAVVLLSAILVVSVNLLIDISYGWLDPRIRYE